jgi:hypothetical protein
MDNFAAELNSLFEMSYLRTGSAAAAHAEHAGAEADHALHEEHRSSYAMQTPRHNVG